MKSKGQMAPQTKRAVPYIPQHHLRAVEEGQLIHCNLTLQENAFNTKNQKPKIHIVRGPWHIFTSIMARAVVYSVGFLATDLEKK